MSTQQADVSDELRDESKAARNLGERNRGRLGWRNTTRRVVKETCGNGEVLRSRLKIQTMCQSQEMSRTNPSQEAQIVTIETQTTSSQQYLRTTSTTTDR